MVGALFCHLVDQRVAAAAALLFFGSLSYSTLFYKGEKNPDC